ncbi:hypothetical protein L7F22_009471 [Adiantum nelumboides]|nr:hypothetical protein [Adiantum nelumboides]
MKADGAFIGQDAFVTPLIGKLRIHIQGYVDKEYFFISPLKHEDVILGAPWFDRLAASIKFPERRISFKFREKNMYIDAQESGNTIPLVHTHAFDKSIKSSISVYMIFVKDSSSDVNKTQMNESGSKEDLELSKFLNQFQDVFIDDIPGELPPKRGDDDHAIELIPGSSPPNKPPYRVSQAQQEEIMRQVNELVEKGMVRPSSSPFCSPVLLVHKKDGTYRMCVDYRALNKITIKNRFLVPCIEDLFDKLQGSTYCSRIDLKSGYHQIRIVNEDILKTAFCTTFGLYEYLVMPFGLTNAPATFNRMMERIFRPHRNFTGVFFDDVIIYSKSMEEHKKHLQLEVPIPSPSSSTFEKSYDIIELESGYLELHEVEKPKRAPSPTFEKSYDIIELESGYLELHEVEKPKRAPSPTTQPQPEVVTTPLELQSIEFDKEKEMTIQEVVQEKQSKLAKSPEKELATKEVSTPLELLDQESMQEEEIELAKSPLKETTKEQVVLKEQPQQAATTVVELTKGPHEWTSGARTSQ